MLVLIQRIFEVAKIKEDEIESICGVTLTMALLENVPDIDALLNGIISWFIGELATAKTTDYKQILT